MRANIAGLSRAHYDYNTYHELYDMRVPKTVAHNVTRVHCPPMLPELNFNLSYGSVLHPLILFRVHKVHVSHTDSSTQITYS